MSTTGRCKVCAAPRIADIDAGLRGGETASEMGRRHGYSSQLMGLHWRRCRDRGRKPTVPPPAPPADAPKPEALVMPKVPTVEPGDPNEQRLESLRQLRQIHGAALKVYAKAYDEKDARTMFLALPALRKNIETKDSLEAKLVKPQTKEESLETNTEWLAFLPRLLRAFDGCCPTCRESLLAVLSTELA